MLIVSAANILDKFPAVKPSIEFPNAIAVVYNSDTSSCSLDSFSVDFSSDKSSKNINIVNPLDGQLFIENHIKPQDKDNFVSLLANWAVQENISRTSVNSLLTVLKSHLCHKLNLSNCARI